MGSIFVVLEKLGSVVLAILEIDCPAMRLYRRALTNSGASGSGATAFIDFADLSFTSATISAQAAVIYNANTTATTNTNAAVMVLDFGAVKTSTSGTFTIQFPTADSSNAILRIS